MRYTAYIRDTASTQLLDTVQSNNIKECWKASYSVARYWKCSNFQIITDRDGKKYKRYYVL